MEKLLKTYTYIDGVNDTPFPNAESQIELAVFKYDAKRMGGAPLISCTVTHPTCLDKVWNDNVYVNFNGEKYFLKQTPTSSKNNTELGYKHECEFISERFALDNVYFIDAVVGSPIEGDRQPTNSATFSFFGNIFELASRLNASLEYCHLDYRVSVGKLYDPDGNVYEEEEKFLSFDKVPFSVALQEAYNQFGVPYYFDGKNIVFDYFQHKTKEPFKYGRENELLSIVKTNANQKIVNRCTGVGSNENIPYYYPNEHPLGKVNPIYKTNNGEVLVDKAIEIKNDEKYAQSVKLSDIISYKSTEKPIPIVTQQIYRKYDYNQWHSTYHNSSVAALNNAWFLSPTLDYSDSIKEQYTTALMAGYKNYSQATNVFEISPQNDAVCFRIGIDSERAPQEVSIRLLLGIEEGTSNLVISNLVFKAYKKITNTPDNNYGVQIKNPDKKDGSWGYAETIKWDRGFVGIDDCFYLVLEHEKNTPEATTEGTPNYSHFLDVAHKYHGYRSSPETEWFNISYSRIFMVHRNIKYRFYAPYGVYSIQEFDDENGEPVNEVVWGVSYGKADKWGHSVPYIGSAREFVPTHRYARIFVANSAECQIKVIDTLVKTYYFEPNFDFINTLHEGIEHWTVDNSPIQLDTYGLSLSTTPQIGDTISFELEDGSLLPYQKNLMPPIYIESGGKERYYNALQNTYKDEFGNYYEFDNVYSENRRKEHIVDFPNIKPSIEYVKNDKGENINTFIDLAYDTNDNDEINADGEYVHPYFYAKLRRFGSYKVNINGELIDASFNLFDHASTQGDMTFDMLSGDCGACKFVIAVDDETKKNTLQVDDNGDLIWRDGKPIFGGAQDRQNDTVNNEVWIALKKDTQTYGTIMPTKTLKPMVGDKFVITNISFPKVYLYEAGERLKEAIIKFMYENNMEKFTFSIKFSRIYLEEHSTDVLPFLNENSLIQIEYNGEIKTLYVNSFAYKKEVNTLLPEITVELAQTLRSSQNALQTAITEVKADVLDSVQKMDIAAIVATRFLAKDVEDTAYGLLHFTKGTTFGEKNEAKIDEHGNAEVVSQVVKQFISTPRFSDGFAGEGFKIWLDENGKSNLTVDNLTARDTFRVFEMLVTQLRAVNGGLFVSAANGTIKDVVENGDYYDIAIENENMFVAGDYMRCEVMNGLEPTSYWVEVESVNGNICKVLKSEFNGSTPLIGHQVVLDGSKNYGRQSAIHISSSNDGTPRIDIYSGISKKTHANCLHTRLGDLTGIVDEHFGANIPSGDGLYSDNAYLKGEFILKNSGESVETKFAIQEGSIKSSVEQIQAEAIKGRTLLYNASFTKGLEGWLTSDDKLNFTNGLLLLSSGNAVTNSVYVSGKPIFDDVYCLTINNGWIKQFNNSFVDKPQFDAEKQYPLFFSTNIRCNESGVLNVYLTNIEASNANTFIGYSDGKYVEGDYIFVNLANNNTSYALQLSEFGSISAGDKIAVKIGEEPKLFNLTQGYEIPLTDWREEQISDDDVILSEPCNLIYTGKVNKTAAFAALDIDNLVWNGKGDFYLSFTGEADFYGLTIFTEKTEVRHQTLFEQTEKLIKISAQNFDSNGNVLESSSITTTAKMNAAISEKFNEDGSLKNTAGIVTSTDLENMDLVDNEQLQGQLSNYVETESFAGLFATAVENDENVVKTATLAAYVKEDELGNLVSEIDIEADQINLTGYNINVDAANFKVKEDGSIVAKNAELNGYLLNMPVRIIQDNYAEFFDGGTTAWQTKKPVLANCVIIQHTSAIHNNNGILATRIDLPGVTFRDVASSQQVLDLVRSFIGQTITIYNETTDNKVYVYYVGNNPTEGSKQVQLKSHSFVSFKCNISAIKYSTSDTEYKEFVYWELLGQGSMRIPEL